MRAAKMSRWPTLPRATGDLARSDACHFTGTITLPEAGRWMVGARFAYDDREVEVWLPVSVTDTPATFESIDWLHAVDAPESGWSTGRMALLALGGLAVGGLATLAWRRVRPAPRTP
jgi:hypothetical protein